MIIKQEIPDQVGNDNQEQIRNNTMITVTNLSKVFRTEQIETTALNGVSF